MAGGQEVGGVLLLRMPDVGDRGDDLPGHQETVVRMVSGHMADHKPEIRGQRTRAAARAWLWQLPYGVGVVAQASEGDDPPRP